VNFNIAEYFHFCNRLLIKEPKERGKAPAMLVFCSFQQLQTVVQYGEKYGFKHNIPLVFIKNYSPQVLKANMKIVGAAEYGLLLYRDKLPKFHNDRQMVFNWFPWERDGPNIPKIHETQKPVKLLKRLIEIFTDPGDVVIDPCAGSGSTLRAAYELGRDRSNLIIDAFDRAPEVEAVVLPPNDPLTMEELREMDGQPVWVVGVSKVNNFKGHWDICEWDGDEGVIFPYCGETPDMDLLGTSWFAYRHRLEEGSDK